MKSFEYYEHFREYICNNVFHPSLSRLERSEMRRGFSNFTIKDGRLFYVGPKRRYMRMVVLTEGEKVTVLQECHINLKTGKHRGMRDTRNRVIAGFFWSTLIKDVTNWVISCHCHNKSQIPVSHSIKVKEAWEVIGLDLFGPLPETARGNQYVMTMTDLHTKWVAAEPLKCKSAGEVSEAIVSKMYSYGMVRKILANQQKGFVNEVNDRIFQMLQLKDSVSCAYQRQTSKQDKRKHLDIKRALRKYFKETPDDWDLQLSAVVYGINTTQQAFTKHTSYSLMFHRQPQSPELMNDCPFEDGEPEDDVSPKAELKVIYNIEMPQENEQEPRENRKRKLEKPRSVPAEDSVPVAKNTNELAEAEPPARAHLRPLPVATPTPEDVRAVVEVKKTSLPQQELSITRTRSQSKREGVGVSATASLQDHRYCLPKLRPRDHDHLYAYPQVKWEKEPSPPQEDKQFSSQSPGIMELSRPPSGLEAEYAVLFTTDSCHFLHELISTFDEEVDQILRLRAHRKAYLDLSGELPDFLESTAHVRTDPAWKVAPVPPRLQKRHVDIGDLAPCDTERFVKALQSPAQGIQVDFDDGNCPTFHNQIKGIHNIVKAVYKQLPDVPHISQAPVLMLRPRAWNMVEHNLLVNGKEAPGPLFDFGLIIFHCGKQLLEHQSGPFFYLSKVESYMEARLWNKIFVWTQQKLGLPLGSIRATVLIENVLASFEMEEILYELRDHSAGLNCGIWDYSASFINKFGHRPAFLLPDRSKYVDMEKHFLRSYMDLLVQTCHRRGALATGGMAALLLPQDPLSDSYKRVLQTVKRLKLLEINAGVDGFMVYDLNLIEPMQELFQLHTKGDNQLQQLRSDVSVAASDLLRMPPGGVTLYGVRYNIAVGVLFIKAWLSGKGHFSYRGQVEDSATAEISRSQLWQWIRHKAQLEDDSRLVSKQLVTDLTKELLTEMSSLCDAVRTDQMLHTAANMFLEVVVKRDFPEFITTYLNEDHTFLSYHCKAHVEVPDKLQQSRL